MSVATTLSNIVRAIACLWRSVRIATIRAYAKFSRGTRSPEKSRKRASDGSGISHHQNMNNGMDRIFSDTRLARIFGEQSGACAIELWILQLRAGEKVTNRLAYGRLLPCTSYNDRWNAQREDSLREVSESLGVQVKRVAAFASAGKAQRLLAKLSEGASLAEASLEAELQISEHAQRFSELTLGSALSVRPVMHLPTRDYFQFKGSRLSQAAMASMDSAAITSHAKSDLFSFDGLNQPDVANLVVDILNAETGLDFSNLDAWRIGDLEIGVFPALSDDERPIVEVRTELRSTSPGVRVRIDHSICSATQLLEVELQLINDDALFHVERAIADVGQVFPLEMWFRLPDEYRGMVNALVVEINAREAASEVRYRRYQWGATLVRDVVTEMQMHGAITRVQFDWLSKALRPKHRPRLEAAQEVSRQTHSSRQNIGKKGSDIWVDINRHMTRLVRDLVPQSSTARFFERYSEGENTGRLELAEWLKRLFSANQDKHIAWFDPYMEDVGVALINQYGFTEGNYIVFTNETEPQFIDNWSDHLSHWNARGPVEDQPDTPSGTRLSRLVSACRAWKEQLSGVRLKVVGLPEGTFHDRMILIRDEKMEPVAGYHLSNSIQKANENYPLLITPIPPNVLRQICSYADRMLGSVLESTAKSSADRGEAMILFDSSSLDQVRRAPVTQTQAVFSMPQSGHVFACWSGDAALQSLNGDALRDQLRAAGHLDQSDGLSSETFSSVPAALWTDSSEAQEFNAWWDAFSVILANSVAGNYIGELPEGFPKRNAELVAMLHAYLDPQRPDALQPIDRGPLPNIMEHFKQSHESLLPSAHWLQGFDLFSSSLSWGDQFAIRVLWCLEPTALTRWMEEQGAVTDESNRRRQLALNHAIARILSRGGAMEPMRGRHKGAT
ncbi:VPA1262 family protein [Burkholderia cepacia]|uniref:VPA1262 family protein n=1 Tax=Burkholderia cepacia TaxID=292 RepID=UPI001C936BF2|nr:VPA1262 family protein [Burkholderia cepacia]MBY4715488.1 hypothetical protein [Burkholderia cepacia]MBY4741445.1 hypothetical protein [Burkholderia cepacia]MBY4748951.1 hypothetical protein [Burkholderia cepacia]MBY4758777.1 hypothetical protein [Burkholderia cepacia]MBY4779144.1 hypothetical protein [Burkholderia cepacia]